MLGPRKKCDSTLVTFSPWVWNRILGAPVVMRAFELNSGIPNTRGVCSKSCARANTEAMIKMTSPTGRVMVCCQRVNQSAASNERITKVVFACRPQNDNPLYRCIDRRVCPLHMTSLCLEANVFRDGIRRCSPAGHTLYMSALACAYIRSVYGLRIFGVLFKSQNPEMCAVDRNERWLVIQLTARDMH